MGRLIDADEMTKRLQEWNRNDDIDKALYNFAMHRIIEQPTAFDVEAVVKEVQDIGTRFCTTIHCNNECENCDHGSIMKAVIDVVRKGGAE